MPHRSKPIAVSLMVASLATVLLAPFSSASVCGFDGVTSNNLGGGDDGHYEEAVYTNCSNHNVRIRVDHSYASKEECVSTGETRLSVDPNLGP